MSEENIQAEHRRSRVERLKKCIILMLITVITLPLILCVCVLVQLHNFNRALENISKQVESLTWVTEKQQEQLEQLTEEIWRINQQAAAENEVRRQMSENRQEVPDTEQNTELLPPKETAEITAAHRVYLTFDDGPSVYTQEILDILDKYEVKATFFVVGKETNYAREAMKRIVEDGHTLGMHSYSHKYSEVYASLESFAGDFVKIQDYLYEVTGVRSTVYRFPGGSSNTVSKIPMENFARYLNEQGIVFYDWNVATGDGGVPLLSAETLVKNSVDDILKHETSVILMHDSADKKTTVEALPTIIESILALEDTVILPITEETRPVQHIHWSADAEKHPTEEGMEE